MSSTSLLESDAAPSRSIRFVDAGHGLAFVRRVDGTVNALLPYNLPIGAFHDAVYRAGETHLEPGDALVIYSDGIIDASPNLNVSPQDLADRLCGARSAQEMVDRLCALSSSSGPPEDDVTVLVLRCTEDGG